MKCHYGECHYSECRQDDNHGALIDYFLLHFPISSFVVIEPIFIFKLQKVYFQTNFNLCLGASHYALMKILLNV
jgi:hypothetical protein